MYILVVLSALLLANQSCAAPFDYLVDLRANPETIEADGESETIISAEVKDDSGSAVPDGTVVEFTASMGVIDRRAETEAGVARVRLRSSTNTGACIVTAVVAQGRAVAEMEVPFVEKGSLMFGESYIQVTSAMYLAYEIERNIIEAAGGVTIRHRGIEIEAEEAVIDVERNVLVAKAKTGGANVIIRKDNEYLEASALQYKFNTGQGVLLTPADEHAMRFKFRSYDLLPRIDDQPDKNVDFDLEPPDPSRILVKARSLIIRPGKEVKIIHATFFSEAERLFSIPLYVVSLKGQFGGFDQAFTYGTEGLVMNLPIYYMLTPNQAGAVRVKHSETSSWGYYTGQSGLSFDVEQEYYYGGKVDGKLTLNRVTSSDWGVRWNQRNELGNAASLYTYVDYPRHKNIFANADYNQSFDDFRMLINMRGSILQDTSDKYFSRLTLQSRTRPLVKDLLSYTATAKLSYDTSLSTQSSKFGQGVGMQLYGEPVKLWSGASLNTSVLASKDWGGSFPGSTITAQTGLFTSIGNKLQAGLNYNYYWTNTVAGISSQRISADLTYRPIPTLQSRLYTTYGLTDSSTTGFGDLTYYFAPSWYFRFINTFQHYDTFDFTDYEVAVVRMIGRMEARLIWSDSRQRVRLEFSSPGF